MSTDKGGSDLDVFKDLKPQTPDGKPITDSKKTLMGIQLPEGVLPPVPGSRSVPPPPPSKRSSHPAAAESSSVASAVPSNLLVSNPVASEAVASTPLAPDSSQPSSSQDGLAGTGVANPSQDIPDATVAGLAPPVPPSRSSPLFSPTAADDSSNGRPSRLGLDSWSTTQPSAPHTSPVITNAAPSVPAPAASDEDIGWDDDDDKTQIYDKDTQSAAQSLLQPASSGYATLPGGRAPPPMSRPPGSIPPPGAPVGFAGRSTAPPATGAAHPIPPVPGTPVGQVAGISPKVLYPLGIVMAVLIAVALYTILPKKGNLTVTVAGGLGNKALSSVEIYLDNRLRCKTSPCEIPRIRPGTHYVEIRAAGYQSTAKRAISIPEGETAVINERLMRSGTGIRVFGDAEQTGMLLRVDGKEFGPLPQELRELDAGEHVIEVSISGPKKRYATFQQRVVVEPSLMTAIGPIRLKVLKGLATIRAGEGAEGAEVTLKVGKSRRALPALPLRLDIETKERHILIARRKGFTTYEEEIVFEDGKAEKTFEITLIGRSAIPQRNAAPTQRRAAPRRAAPAAAPKAAKRPAATMAKLDINSTPPSNVLLDGKPLGATPLRGITVSPGPHRVIFINGSERKPVRINAVAGTTEKVNVTF